MDQNFAKNFLCQIGLKFELEPDLDESFRMMYYMWGFEALFGRNRADGQTDGRTDTVILISCFLKNISRIKI